MKALELARQLLTYPEAEVNISAGKIVSSALGDIENEAEHWDIVECDLGYAEMDADCQVVLLIPGECVMY